ncbi:MAG: ParB/RepB/Spo0J family partition protein [Halocynthiibacter sp.]
MAEKKPKRRGLGRGLSALMADVTSEGPATGSPSEIPKSEQHIPVENIAPNPDQPRRRFGQEDLASLAESIREKGVIQPLIVRKNPDKPGLYQIVAGERRWRAAQIAQLHELPVVVRDFTDTEVLEVAIIENIQRSDLNPVEEAAGYRQLMDRFGHTQEKLALALSKSRSHIANLLRLLQLPEEVQDYLREGSLSIGHARAMITTNDPLALARQVVAKGLSVRETERLAKTPKVKPVKTAAARADKDADTRALEGDLSANTGMKVTIEQKPGQAGGQVLIRYKSLEDLDEICRILTAMPPDGSR